MKSEAPKQGPPSSEWEEVDLNVLEETEIRDVRNALEKNAKKERELGEPEVHFEIAYIAHGTEEDFKKVGERFSDADVYVPEFFGWSPRDLGTFRIVSEGLLSPLGALRRLEFQELNPSYGFLKASLEALYGSKKPVIIFDVPSDHQLLDQYFIAFGHRVKELAPQMRVEKNFEKVIGTVAELSREEAGIQKAREEYMFSQADPKIHEVLELYPDLKKKDSIKVLLSLGLLHSGVYHAFKKSDSQTSRVVAYPEIFGPQAEVMRLYRFGKEVHGSLVAQAICEAIIMAHYRDKVRKEIVAGHEVKRMSQSSQKLLMLLGKIARKFDFTEIKEIFERRNEEDFSDFLDVKIEGKGVHFPESEEELNKFLGIKE